MIFCSANEKNRLPLAYDGALSLLSESNTFSEPLLETNLVLYLDYLDVLINNKIYNILDQDTSFHLLPLFLLVSTLIFHPFLQNKGYQLSHLSSLCLKSTLWLGHNVLCVLCWAVSWLTCLYVHRSHWGVVLFSCT